MLSRRSSCACGSTFAGSGSSESGYGSGWSGHSTTPRTSSRRRCSGPGDGSAPSKAGTSLRRWLYTIATNACLNALEREPRVVLFPARRRRGSAAARESRLAVPPPAARDAASLRRPRLVGGGDRREIGELLETSPAAVNSGLQRARSTLEGRPPPRPTDEDERVLLERFVDARDRVDIEGLVWLLKEDAVLAMPPEAVLGRRGSRGIFRHGAGRRGPHARQARPRSSESAACARRLFRRVGVRNHGLRAPGRPDRRGRRLR
jgi:hypothetical protein